MALKMETGENSRFFLCDRIIMNVWRRKSVKKIILRMRKQVTDLQSFGVSFQLSPTQELEAGTKKDIMVYIYKDKVEVNLKKVHQCRKS